MPRGILWEVEDDGSDVKVCLKGGLAKEWIVVLKGK